MQHIFIGWTVVFAKNLYGMKRYFCVCGHNVVPQLLYFYLIQRKRWHTERVTRGDNPKQGCRHTTNGFISVAYQSLGKWATASTAQREKVVSISCLCPWCVSNLHSLKPSLTGALLSFPVPCFSSNMVVILLVFSPTIFLGKSCICLFYCLLTFTYLNVIV